MMPPAILLATLLEGDLGAFAAGLVAAGPTTVPRDMDLKTYLDEARCPRWKQKLLLLYERVQITRKQPDGSLAAPETAHSSADLLRAGDMVDANDQPQGNAFDAEYDGARDGARDYAFAPDDDPWDPFLALTQTLYSRSGAEMFSRQRGEATLQDFVHAIRHSETTEGPPRNLVLISHAHWSGQLEFAPTSSSDPGTFFTFEDIASIGPALQLPKEYLEPRTNANTPARLIFTGCAFGQAEPFLKKLRDAINPKLAAIAPKFMFGIAKVDGKQVYFEYMAKPYTLYSKKTMTRAELIAELIRLGLKDAHTDAVKPGEWDDWVPAEPWPAPAEYFYFEQQLFRTTLWFSTIEEEMPPVNVSVNQATFEADKIPIFKAAVAALPPNPLVLLSAACPFPWWKRFGLDDANKMIDALDWQFVYTAGSGGGASTVVATAIGYRYSLLVPIVLRDQTKPYKRRRVLGNYYGPGPIGSGHVLQVEDYPLPKLPLAAHPASNTKYWAAIEPAP